ncbi:MAG TPA: Crp/Fnr family transcriptional regulator [Pyrinomonadaceae bacterium]|jgi:CRP-like cAMP-binding protein
MSATNTQIATQNRMLAALPTRELERMTPHLEEVSLKLSAVLFVQDEEVEYVYFPVDAIVSLLTSLEDGDGVEVGLVGREGMVGLNVALGVGRASKVATVQRAGLAFRMKATRLKEEFDRRETLHDLLLRYTHALMSQVSQSVVCNVRHKASGRLARWLLMFQDRAETDVLFLTHEFMAHMLGVRRSTVGEIAEELQSAGLISYHRGEIHILNRQGLIDLTCECYAVVKEEFDLLYAA